MLEYRAFILFCDEKKKKRDHEGSRTLNLQTRSRTPYPLGHAANRMKGKALYFLAFGGNNHKKKEW